VAKISPGECVLKIQNRLDSVTWKDNSGAVVLVPELEEWLWQNDSSICRRFGVSGDDLRNWTAEFAGRQRTTVENVKQSQPKELLEFICLDKVGRTISPKDFEVIASTASLTDWLTSKSFASVVSILRNWFPNE